MSQKKSAGLSAIKISISSSMDLSVIAALDSELLLKTPKLIVPPNQRFKEESKWISKSSRQSSRNSKLAESLKTSTENSYSMIGSEIIRITKISDPNLPIFPSGNQPSAESVLKMSRVSFQFKVEDSPLDSVRESKMSKDV